jgi:peptidyl-tRNA hydrolase, PTH2 family
MKQVIVMRADLNMRKGKMIAQGAHASLGAVLPYVDPHRAFRIRLVVFPSWWRKRRAVNRWLSGPFKKICVRVDSEEALLAVHKKAAAADLITCLITDSGLTEFGGVPTNTCCAVGPATDEEVDLITGGLKLL